MYPGQQAYCIVAWEARLEWPTLIQHRLDALTCPRQMLQSSKTALWRQVDPLRQKCSHQLSLQVTSIA